MTLVPTNGYIQPITATGGGFNEKGNPVKVESQLLDRIPARIETNSKSNKGKYQDGRFVICSYTCYITGNEFNYSRLKVIINNVEKEFDIQDIQILQMTGQVKIIV